MEAFTSHRARAKKLEQQLQRRERSLNPNPKRSTTESMRIRRCLDGIKERLTYWMTETQGQDMKWMPYVDTITDKAEEHYYLAKEFYDSSKRDQYGNLTSFLNHSLRASNKISVASWYENSIGKLFYVVKVIHSPIPCDTWGWLPLSRKHWNVVVLELMAAHQDWQWIHAVRQWTDDDTFQSGGIVGWHMEPAAKIYTKDYVPCTGQVIYSHVIEKFLELAPST